MRNAAHSRQKAAGAFQLVVFSTTVAKSGSKVYVSGYVQLPFFYALLFYVVPLKGLYRDKGNEINRKLQ